MATFFSGREGSATVNAVSMYTSKWDCEVERTRIDTTYMKGSASDALAWRDFISGFKAGTMSMEGPYDPAQGLPFNSAAVAYSLLIGSTYTIAGTMAVLKIGISHDIENAARWRCSGAMVGAPTLGVTIS